MALGESGVWPERLLRVEEQHIHKASDLLQVVVERKVVMSDEMQQSVNTLAVAEPVESTIDANADVKVVKEWCAQQLELKLAQSVYWLLSVCGERWLLVV